jgi:GntR family transcriptional regulator
VLTSGRTTAGRRINVRDAPPQFSSDDRRVGYREIAAVIQEWARGGRYQPGDRLPTEAELTSLFRVSRVTIRRALALLTTRGVLEARQGAGTFIASGYRPPAVGALARPVGRGLDEWGDGLSFRYLGWSNVAVPAQEARDFGAKPGQQFMEMAYLRLLRDKPLAFLVFQVPPWVSDMIEDKSEAVLLHLTAYLKQRGLGMTRYTKSIGAVVADPTMARQLDLAAGDPLVRITMRVWDQGDRLFAKNISYYRADLFEYDLAFQVPGVPERWDEMPPRAPRRRRS